MRKQDIYFAENQIVKNLPEMIDKATNLDLTSWLSAHFEETKKHVEGGHDCYRKLAAALQQGAPALITGISTTSTADHQLVSAAARSGRAYAIVSHPLVQKSRQATDQKKSRRMSRRLN